MPLRAVTHSKMERHAEYCCLMTGQENERGAPSYFETKCPEVVKFYDRRFYREIYSTGPGTNEKR